MGSGPIHNQPNVKSKLILKPFLLASSFEIKDHLSDIHVNERKESFIDLVLLVVESCLQGLDHSILSERSLESCEVTDLR